MMEVRLPRLALTCNQFLFCQQREKLAYLQAPFGMVYHRTECLLVLDVPMKQIDDNNVNEAERTCAKTDILALIGLSERRTRFKNVWNCSDVSLA